MASKILFFVAGILIGLFLLSLSVFVFNYLLLGFLGTVILFGGVVPFYLYTTYSKKKSVNKQNIRSVAVGLAIGVLVPFVFIFIYSSTHCVFCGANLVYTTCIASPGYLCANAALNTNGQFSSQFGQNTGSAEYNVELACARGGDSNTEPNNVSSWTGISNSTLQSGQIVSITGLQCYDPNGLPFSASIGSSFEGFLWLNYTNSTAAPSNATNPWHTVNVATIVIKTT